MAQDHRRQQNQQKGSPSQGTPLPVVVFGKPNFPTQHVQSIKKKVAMREALAKAGSVDDPSHPPHDFTQEEAAWLYSMVFTPTGSPRQTSSLSSPNPVRSQRRSSQYLKTLIQRNELLSKMRQREAYLAFMAATTSGQQAANYRQQLAQHKKKMEALINSTSAPKQKQAGGGKMPAR